ncbi:MAG: hypothetical protein HRU15_17780, partial [Planctomycetes bacterium]|nr:hypothetical protein [Planctomycetota bacterium]
MGVFTVSQPIYIGCIVILCILHIQLTAQELVLQCPLTSAATADHTLPAGARAIQAQIIVPEGAPTDLGVGAFIKDDDGSWFQLAKQIHLRPGHHHLHFPLNCLNSWNSEPGLQQWNDFQKHLGHHFGIYFWSEQSSTTAITIQHIRTVSNDLETQTSTLNYQLQNLNIEHYNKQSGQAHLQTGKRWSIHMNPSPMPNNPYDSDLFQLDLIISDPQGQEICLPAFYQQGIELSEGGDHERATINNLATFSARFRPMQAGTYNAHLEARWQGNDHTQLIPLPDLIVSGDAYDPYIRVDKNDVRFFSYGAGEKKFHWPCGLNIQCISDKRAIQRIKNNK